MKKKRNFYVIRPFTIMLKSLNRFQTKHLFNQSQACVASSPQVTWYARGLSQTFNRLFDFPVLPLDLVCQFVLFLLLFRLLFLGFPLLRFLCFVLGGVQICESRKEGFQKHRSRVGSFERLRNTFKCQNSSVSLWLS